MIDLTAAVKILEKEISEKQIKIENLEAQIMVLKQDMKAAESQISELESTNQLLKVYLRFFNRQSMVSQSLITSHQMHQ